MERVLFIYKDGREQELKAGIALHYERKGYGRMVKPEKNQVTENVPVTISEMEKVQPEVKRTRSRRK